jgi:hypothetical protein
MSVVNGFDHDHRFVILTRAIWVNLSRAQSNIFDMGIQRMDAPDVITIWYAKLNCS